MTYIIKENDTLSEIAERLLGSADQWRQIYAINRKTLNQEQRRRNMPEGPHWIFPGTEIQL
jgi:nucleoid-associated protein YgaU